MFMYDSDEHELSEIIKNFENGKASDISIPIILKLMVQVFQFDGQHLPCKISADSEQILKWANYATRDVISPPP